MKQGETYILMYAAGICLVGSLLLAGATAGLKSQQEKMVELDRKTNVLKAFQEPIADGAGRKLPGDRIEARYAEHVREVWVDPDGKVVEGLGAKEAADGIAAGRVLSLFQWVEGGTVRKYAFPVSGKGLWSTIYGYLALDESATTIVGVSFYKHGETPGLGGEIEQAWFQDQFKGRRVVADGRPIPVVVAKGKASPEASTDKARVVVDGISGATLTGNGVMAFLNAGLKRYEAYFKTARKG
ncbi:MAG: FMN-binding protein [Lentisphaerae bacterium]|nr:FMN-binding protein [Lentisphaerota bacterium]